MTVTVDYATTIGQVRLLIADTDENQAIFQDDAITAFLAMALDGDVKRAAASALLAIAANEAFVHKRIRILDLQTDGPAVARELREQAKMLRLEAEQDEAAEEGGAFDTIEMVNSPAAYSELLLKQHQRGL